MKFRLAVLSVFFLLTQAFGQAPDNPERAQPANTPPAESDPFGRLTPYGCVVGFLRATDAEDYTRAAEYLNTSAAPSHAQELAQQLQVLLDFGLAGNLSKLARAPEGDLLDGLAPSRERAGSIQLRSRKLDILLDRVQTNSGTSIWLFSSDTLRGVPSAFAEIDAPFLVRLFPRPMVEIRILGLPLWRWLIVIIGITVSLLSASLVTRALAPLLRRSLHRVTGEADSQRLDSLRDPVRLLLLAGTMRLLSSLSLSLLSRQFWTAISAVLAVIGFAWLAMRLSDIVSDLTAHRLVRRHKPDSIAMLSLARRIFKIVVVLATAVLLLQRAGVNVTAMLAGLGVGGIALALAAQKTLENVFGGISIIMRETIRVGDSCRIADQTGTIEDIGLGSTRLRTLDRTVVSIPNAQLSQQNTENMSLRDKFWIHQILRLRGDTQVEQMRSVLSGIDGILSSQSGIEPLTLRNRFIEFGRGSLVLEIFAYIREADYESFLRTQQEILLRIMDVITASGAVLASPAPVIDVRPAPQPDNNRELERRAPVAASR